MVFRRANKLGTTITCHDNTLVRNVPTVRSFSGCTAFHHPRMFSVFSPPDLRPIVSSKAESSWPGFGVLGSNRVVQAAIFAGCCIESHPD